MTQDYKTRSGPRPTRRRHGHASCVWWFLLGTMLGSFGVGMTWMLQSPPPGAPVAANGAEPETTPGTPAPPQKPQFTFHDILPDTRVDVPREEPEHRPPPLPPPPPRTTEQSSTASTPASKSPVTPAAAASGSYLLQIGAFRRSSDADSQKAKLALLGVQARVNTAQVNGVTYHRVVAGPYPGKQQAEQVRARLTGSGLDSFTTKVK